MRDGERNANKRHIVWWLLDRGQRAQLLTGFPPAYRDAIADHVMLSSSAEPKPPPIDTIGEIVGQVDDSGDDRADQWNHRPSGTAARTTSRGRSIAPRAARRSKATM
jgi:hypothetical protein